MDRSSDKSPIFRFKDDPIHSLIMETLSKKPINSDHYSLVKRIKITDYINRPVSTESMETVAKRSKEYMNSVGFAYGRLQEKDWVSETIKKGKLRIHAPGPVVRSNYNEDEIEEFDLPETYKNKKLVGFQKPRHSETPKKSEPKPKTTRVVTTKPTTRISASQRQAREYLTYLNALSSQEQEFINTQISQKRKELTRKCEDEARQLESDLNEKGIFSPVFNKERVNSMVPVKMLSQNKVCVEPMMRNAKEIVMREKMKELQFGSLDIKKNKSEKIETVQRKDKLIDVVESTITKKQMKNKKRETDVLSPQKKVKMHWVDRLNQTMGDAMIKTRPDEKLLSMLAVSNF